MMCAHNQLNGQLQAEVNLPPGKQPAVPLHMRLGGPLKKYETNILPHSRESNGGTHPVRSVVGIPTELSLSDMSCLPATERIPRPLACSL
jgi:hypothetical protein